MRGGEDVPETGNLSSPWFLRGTQVRLALHVRHHQPPKLLSVIGPCPFGHIGVPSVTTSPSTMATISASLIGPGSPLRKASIAALFTSGGFVGAACRTSPWVPVARRLSPEGEAGAGLWSEGTFSSMS